MRKRGEIAPEYRDRYAEVMRLARLGWPTRHIVRETGMRRQTVNEWRRKCQQ